MRSTEELKLYHWLITRVIKENPDDPRIETPKESLRIIEIELERRETMAKNFKRMSIDELEDFRNDIAAQKVLLTEDFIAAGKVLNVKRQEAELDEEQAELDEKKDELKKMMPKSQVVKLKTLVMKVTKGKLGG
jgi:hypothetical protein